MALSPDEIERREFALVSLGYDADEVRKFLLEVAATVRMSRHDTHPPDLLRARTTADIPDDLRTDAARWPARGHDSSNGPVDAVSFFIPPAVPRVAPATRPATRETTPGKTSDTAAAAGGADPFDQVGTQVAELMRAAHESVTAILEKADLDAAAIRDDAEHDAREIRRRSEADAAWQQDRAKRVLTTVQEQADAIVAEAEAQGRAIVANAAEQADVHAKQVTEKAQRHVEDILRAEREALARLHSAQHDVGRAIEAIVRADNRPVVDVRSPEADLRFATDRSGDGSDGASRADRDSSDPRSNENWSSIQELAQQDPLMQMVRQAVDRAVDAAAGDADPAAATSEDPGDALDRLTSDAQGVSPGGAAAGSAARPGPATTPAVSTH